MDCVHAVKRSRVKSKQRANETKDRVDNLKATNTQLEERIAQKQKQLQTLKDLFLETAKAKTDAGANFDLNKLLADSDED
ncbi:CCAAT/enhancer-binding protein gamma isoform X2 [Sitodiplosis mosellana]|uniref:CCAAT/enhancer-binding protein gamma isoform X2 n=1 Tax=Sitodiplosis mosellana TaxID=263140 RepID=UPI00244484E4|nr:CCAAT/enhancer-binding protein gamma isoform X2 [Sitodiplosis mosellana]